ncbi:MAG: YMGG-like glycine zipper-containing protein [Acetobacteraceae bacterium]
MHALIERHILTAVVLAGLALGLAACGEEPGTRAVSGGAIGAGTGAIIGAATGGGPATGALIGGAIGALGGALTNPNTIDLGRPVIGN